MPLTAYTYQIQRTCQLNIPWIPDLGGIPDRRLEYWITSANWQNNFRVSTGFHRFPGFPKPRNSRNPETSYIIDYLFNHRWTLSISFHEIGHASGLPNFPVSRFLLVSKGCPGGETRGNWNAKVLMSIYRTWSLSNLFTIFLASFFPYHTTKIMDSHVDEETPLLAGNGKKQATPLPWSQFTIVMLLQLAEPLSSNVIYPFMPQVPSFF